MEHDQVIDATNVATLAPSAPYEHEVYGSTTLLASESEAPLLMLQPSAPLEAEVTAEMANISSVTEVPVVVSDETDILALESAAEAREQGVSVIRDHLSSYLEQNPEANYVTWIATLHPENAEVSIDPRFLIPGNPWSTVFEEAKAAARNGVNGNVTTASEEANTAGDIGTSSSAAAAAVTSGDPPRNKNEQSTSPSTSPYYGGLIPLIVGFSMILYSVLVALTLQVTSAGFYLMAVMNYQICQVFPRLNPCTIVFYALPWFLLQVFRFLDSLLLIIDIFLVEVLAAVAYLVCAPLAFSHAVGIFYHQRTRRLAHYVRWACRKPFRGLDPPRVWSIWGTRTQDSVSSSILMENEGSSSEYQLISDNDQEVVA